MRAAAIERTPMMILMTCERCGNSAKGDGGHCTAQSTHTAFDPTKRMLAIQLVKVVQCAYRSTSGSHEYCEGVRDDEAQWQSTGRAQTDFAQVFSPH